MWFLVQVFGLLVFGLLVFVFGLLLFFLVCPCHYVIKIRKEEDWVGELCLRTGFLKITLQQENAGKNCFCLLVRGNKLIEMMFGEGGRKPKRTKWRKTTPKKKEKGEKGRIKFLSRVEFSAWQRLLKGETLGLLVSTGRQIWQEIRPQHSWAQGKVGFANPYYTGLAAAGLASLRPKNINVEVDFFRPVCELALFFRGRIRIAVLIYYLLRLLWVLPWYSLLRIKTKGCQMA